MERVVFVVALASTVLAGSLTAQTTDFSGQWRVNHAAGNPPSPSTSEQIWEVTQTATELRLRLSVNGRETSTQLWPLGGPAVATRRDGIEALTTATLGAGELVISGKGTTATGTETEVKEHWLIDPTTKSLRIAKVLTTGGSTLTRHLVLERVPNR